MSKLSPIIVGAGPAGVRAAQTLVAHGLRPILLDEAPRAGGQIYRQPPPGFYRSKKKLYGFEAGRADSVHQDFAALVQQIDYRPQTLVWNAQPDVLDIMNTTTLAADNIAWQDIIVATGATDRVLPVPGWTTPGVYTLGGAQVALKFQGCAIGRRVVLAGTGPLLYLVAYQYAKAGVQVMAVLDSSSLSDRIAALPDMLGQPALLMKGMYYMAWLMAHRIPLKTHARLLRVEGEGQNKHDEHVRAVVWRRESMTAEEPVIGPEQTIECDALGFGYALRSETQLADLLGCRFGFDAVQRAHLPERDKAGRSSVPGVYLAGDGAGIMGADAAELAGERAALALLQDRGVQIDNARADKLEHRLARIGAFRKGLERAFPFPHKWAGLADDKLIVCRCEQISAGELRQAARDNNAQEMNRLKALTRIGMGRCQGRMCSSAAGEILAQACSIPLAQVGRLRGQAPIKPVPIGMHALKSAPAPVSASPSTQQTASVFHVALAAGEDE
ncbi:FAD/NAD(P)-binding oxidoreductase [Herbaspirillum sp. meg3]|uniref:FAD/NAD(P)-dependent oxidoreductase n=1 Tax=Herbaspirillum sp. meg3 TaxID=2025949 RepID=UPI000B998F41|nr:FAD/NAD(P)-binding oxidoreductase [Herbaspirillum sp. meg3]ASU41156.1 FAD/NAD(P)-binding oxidoreductase [Herbaspirillum sp. meg3]